MDTLARIIDIYGLTIPKRMPWEIPNTGRIEGHPSLAALYGLLNFKVGAEIGTAAGKYAEQICQQSPGVHLYCIDKWEDYPFYRDYKGRQNVLDNAREVWKERMINHKATMIDKYSMDAVGNFADGSLDFIYIDANHEFPFVAEDLFYWSRKVRAGGIVSLHDYYESVSVNSRCHVLPVVNAYTRAFKIYPWFVIGTKAKTIGLIRDSSRSVMWVKDERQP